MVRKVTCTKRPGPGSSWWPTVLAKTSWPSITEVKTQPITDASSNRRVTFSMTLRIVSHFVEMLYFPELPATGDVHIVT